MKETILLLSVTLGIGWADVMVSLDKPNPSFTTGQTFSVNLLASISDPILGFGLDFNFDSSLLTLDSAVVAPSWFAAIGTEANDVVGLAFPLPVSGSTVVETLNFTALNTGSTTLDLAYDSTNLAEGFPLASGGFARSNLRDEAPITGIVPEPSAVFLLGTMAIALLRSFKQRSSVL